MIRIIYSCLLVLLAFVGQAQNAPQMADTFREEGKIYVVITVLAIIFLALAVYLVMIDLKLKKLEDKK